MRETLTAKHRRLRREKCRHEEIYVSTVSGPHGTFTNSVCLDCFASWRTALPIETPTDKERAE